MNEQSVCEILMIDDDPKFCELLRDYLELYSFHFTLAHDGAQGLRELESGSFDLVLLDMFLPDMHGMDVLRALRQKYSLPVLVLSAHNEETDRIVALELGADDYVAKTFSSRELLARIRAVLRRQSGPSAQDGAVSADAPKARTLQLRGLILDDRTKEAWLEKEALDLTVTEYRLLWAMLAEPGRVFSREDLLGVIAERDFNRFDRSVDMHISSLRAKLGEDSKAPKFIKTIRGLGYAAIK